MTTTEPHTTENTTAPAPAFAGASRANQYLELDHTLRGAPSAPPPAPAESAPHNNSAPETVEAPAPGQFDDLGTVAVAAPSRRAQHGVRGWIAKLGLDVKPGNAETAALEQAERTRRYEETIRQATWTRAVSILVANPKGGVGKTPSSLLLGGTLASIRGGSVCVVEVSDDPGALTFRSEGTPLRGLGELVRDTTAIRSAGQLAGYTAPQTSFAVTIGSVGPRPQLDGDAVTAVATVVDEYFSIRVMDSGNQPSSSAFQAAVATADVMVVPMFDAGDAALEASSLIFAMRDAGGKSAELAANAIVLRLHDGRPENPQVVERVDRILASHGIAHVHNIPYDAHIAERGQITLAKLAKPIRDAFTAAAADIIHTLKETIR